MTFVQAWRNDESPSANSISVAVNPTAGNALVVWVAGESESATATISDGVSTWAETIDFVSGSQFLTFKAYYALNVPAGARNVTVTFSGGVLNRSIRVEEHADFDAFIGVAGPNEQPTPGTGTDGLTSGPINITQQPAWIVGASLNWSGATANMTAGTGFTDRGSGFDYQGTDYARFEDGRFTATGNTAATFTAGANVRHFTAAMAFTEATGSTVIERTLSESVAVNDFDNWVKERYFLSPADVTDTLSSASELYRRLPDLASVLDALTSEIQRAGAVILSRLLSDSVAVEDLKVRVLERLLFDDVGTAEAVSEQRLRERRLADTAAAHDRLLTDAVLVRLLSEAVSLVDDLDANLIRAVANVIRAAVAAVLERTIDIEVRSAPIVVKIDPVSGVEVDE